MRILESFTAAIALAAVQIASPAAQAEEGTVIQVGPERGVSVDVTVDGEQAESRRDRRQGRRANRGGFGAGFGGPVAVSRYWIGIGGGPLPAELRAQVDLEPDQGVLIRTVSPEGPAAEAGIKQYDILIRANGKPVGDLREVADLVGEQGELKGRITLELLRAGKLETVWVSPAERPEGQPMDLPREGRRERFGRGFRPGGGFEGLFGPGGLQLDGDLLGGEALGGFAEMLPELAGAGVSVQVQRQNEGPAQVTVQQGEKTWQFDEGDEDALNALPADVRPMVQRMLDGGRAVGDDFDGFGFGGPGFQMQFGGDELAGRMRALQERMMGLRANTPAAGADGVVPEIEIPEIEIEEAEPIEIEIPAGE